jgi:hypothetical protein
MPAVIELMAGDKSCGDGDGSARRRLGWGGQCSEQHAINVGGIDRFRWDEIRICYQEWAQFVRWWRKPM